MAVAAAPARPDAVAEHADRSGPWPLATGPVSGVIAVFVLVATLTNSRYGYFGDELYFLATGDHLSWGYADQPPAVPLLAHAMDTLFPGSVLALRMPSVLATAGCVLLAALIAREFGGDRRAQTLAAAAVVVSPHFLGSGHLLVTWSFDQLLWSAVLWLLVRWTRLRHAGRPRDRLLLVAGVLTAVALQVKLLIPALWVVLLTVVLIVGPRALLTRPALWLGGAIAVATTVPTMLWQARNDWPQLRMPQAVASETGSAWGFVEMLGRQAGLVGTVLGVYGLWRLLRSADLRAHRFVGLTALTLIVLFAVVGGRPYYVAGLVAPLVAAGVVGLQRRREARGGSRLWWWVTGSAYALSAWHASAALPLEPVAALQRSDVISTASVGWRSVTDQVAAAHSALPPPVRSETAVVTDDYWSASAIHHFGPRHGIDKAYSTSRGFWYLHPPPRQAEHLLYVGGEKRWLRRHFSEVRRVSTIRTDLPTATYYEGMPVWLVSDQRRPWSALWPDMHHMTMW